MAQYIKEVFTDYTENNNLLDAEIDGVNLYKKTNKLQINIVSSKPIKLSEIESFENYANRRFKVEKTIVDIKYNRKNNN